MTTVIVTLFFSWVNFMIHIDNNEKALAGTQRTRKSVDIIKEIPYERNNVYQF
jgi:hypothetical protein